jgi:two-component system chemotaxis response regulator CheY
MAKNILVVDDSSSIRKIVSLSLKVLDFNIISAEDGVIALEKLSQNSIDLLITDLNMPNMDGYELIKNVRANSTYKDLPIIVLSSLSSEFDINEGLLSGANSYLMKPFNAVKIKFEVAKYLS